MIAESILNIFISFSFYCGLVCLSPIMILLIIDFLAVITTFLMWLSKLELKIILDVLKPVLIQITPLVWLLSSAFILSLAW